MDTHEKHVQTWCMVQHGTTGADDERRNVPNTWEADMPNSTKSTGKLIHTLNVKVRKYTSDDKAHPELMLDEKKSGKAVYYREYALNVTFDFTSIADVPTLIKKCLEPQSIMVAMQAEFRKMSYFELDAIMATDDPVVKMISLGASTVEKTPEMLLEEMVGKISSGKLSKEDALKRINSL